MTNITVTEPDRYQLLDVAETKTSETGLDSASRRAVPSELRLRTEKAEPYCGGAGR